MSTKVHHQVPALGGIGQFKDLLDIIKNREAYDKLLANLEEAHTKAVEAVARIAPAEEVETLRGLLAVEHAEAKRLNSESKVKASQLIQEAKSEAVKIKENSQEKVDSLIEDLRAKNDTANLKELELNRRENSLIKFETSIREREVEANAVAKQAKELRGKWEGKLKRLDALRDD